MRYPVNYQDSKEELYKFIDYLQSKNYTVIHDKQPIIADLAIDKVRFYTQSSKNALVFTLGLHGIEGYVGHTCLLDFLYEKLDDLQDYEITIYHPVNPFGMMNYRRTNENNIDLNRNFSQNEFQSENKGYERIIKFFEPRTYLTPFTANIQFYSSTIKHILKYGIPTLKEATLLGQKVHSKGLYYSGTEYQTSTSYMLAEIPQILKHYQTVTWLDLHTGYGPRYQMSIVNSKYETETTKQMKATLSYPIILGLNAEDFYDIDGDMIEMIYQIKQDQGLSTKLYAACFEFGTLGDSTFNTIESLKAMMLENSGYHLPQKSKVKAYMDHRIKEQFMPSSERWKDKAKDDFHHAMKDVLTFHKPQ